MAVKVAAVQQSCTKHEYPKTDTTVGWGLVAGSFPNGGVAEVGACAHTGDGVRSGLCFRPNG